MGSPLGQGALDTQICGVVLFGPSEYQYTYQYI
jgi:hypothetical protein